MNSGNVGIGTTSPAALLDLGPGETGVYLQKFLLLHTGNARAGWGHTSYEDRIFFPSDGHMSFGTISLTDGSTWAEKVRIQNDGNVGIGTTAPVGKLDVNGSLASKAWTAVTFGTGWSDYGSGYQAVQYKKFGDLVFLRGLASSGANLWATYPIITTLPVGYRPVATLIFDQMGNVNQSVRVDINSAGTVFWQSGGAGSNWISLDGIVFSVD